MLRSIIAAILLAAASASAADVWWEAESPSKTNFPAKTWLSGSNLAKRDQLSGNDWLTADGKRGKDELVAQYTLTVPADGTYNLWSRKFWQHGPFAWRFDNDAAATCGRDIALADNVGLQPNVCANWVHLGKVKLTKGEHTFEIRLLAKEGENATAAFDCFLLTPGPFIPNGKHKPGERTNLAEPDHFPWEPAMDLFTNDAVLDLRFLNEKTAGEKGYIKRTGDHFTLGSGEPVRFFGVNVSPDNAAGSRDAIDYLADALAKRGVNMIRCHGGIYDFSRPDGIDPKKLDNIQYLVAAMKKRGIYTTLSLYFPLWIDAEQYLKMADYAALKNKHPFALLMFDPEFQKIYRTWARTILTTKNPYGPPLAEEPALAIVECQNEDSFFFWTFSKANIPPAKWELLEKQFETWCAKKYGSTEKTLAIWGVGKFELLPAWNMTADGVKNSPGGAKRIGDQVRFLAETQRTFYADTTKFLKQDLKFGGMVEASNWITADPKMLDAIERWTYTATDVVDRHGYFSGKHEGRASGYAVSVGDTYEDLSALLSPEAMPFQVHQVAGFPQIITEIGFTQPNRFRSETTLLSAAYSALQGTDGIYYFAIGSNFLRDAGMGKFQLCDPAIAATFPAAALLYRRGDVREGAPAFYEQLKLDNLMTMKGSASAAALALDELRGVPDTPKSAATFDPLTFFVGPVERALDQTPPAIAEGTKPAMPDLATHIDRKNKTVRSGTGQLTWDYGNALFTINTPAAQSVSGYLARAGKIDLPDLAIDCKNEYASIVAISLDGQPLKSSKKILVQVMTEDKPYGFKSVNGKIADLGGAPFNVRNIKATLTFNGAAFTDITVLDENGYPKTKLKPAATIELPPAAVYMVLSR